MRNTLVTISSDFYITLQGIFIDALVQIPGSCVGGYQDEVRKIEDFVSELSWPRDTNDKK